ncbi:MAG: hypothetical protein NT069_11845, partial [Planctomycetota bacterium]|nr:hypothetical protein [Planctomycetota bacterium]
SDGLHVHGASTHVVEPGELLRIALRPARLGAPMNHNLAPGAYRASVRYVGLKPMEREMIVKHWPDSANATAWGGTVVSNQVPFEVRPDPLAAQPKELVWGEEQDGLRAAVEFRRRHSEDDPDGPPRGADKADEAIPLNSTLNVVLHVKNVSEETITLVSETWRQEDQVAVKTEDDQIVQVAGTWYSGWPTMVRWTLKPGDIADLSGSTLAMASSKEALEDFEHPVGKSFIGHAGKYTAQYTIRIGSIQQRDGEGNVTLPTKDDWKGNLITGETPFELRDRTPADDEAARRKLFTGKIEFVDPEGKKVQGGVFQIRASSARKNLAVGEFVDGLLEVPDCPPKPLTLTVRAHGYEETSLNDLTLRRDEVRQIPLKPSLPARFRLISQGKPIAGAVVRYFNKTCADAGSGPVPVDGIAGPVWGVSGDVGTVVLDTLQKVVPQYPDLGDALYYFYVESPELAPRFVGPIRAGEDAGDMVVGPYLEVRGEIRGTPEEIEHFAAEWDQPFEQTSDNPQATWLYAVSQRLELVPLPKIPNAPKAPPVTRRAFVLKGLSPGKLRIIANFQKRKDGVSHTYGRRDPKGADLLFEFDLTESRDDLVITPAGERGASAP